MCYIHEDPVPVDSIYRASNAHGELLSIASPEFDEIKSLIIFGLELSNKIS